MLTIIASLLFAGCLHAQSAHQPYRPGGTLVPLVYDIADVGDVLSIRMKVNGVEGIFGLDTGTNDSLVTPEFAKKAKLPITVEDELKTAEITFDFGAVKTPERFEVRPIGVKDNGSPGRWRTAGIIGLGAVDSGCLGIDTVNHKVIIWAQSALTDADRDLFFKAVPYSVPGEGVMWALPGADFTYHAMRFRNRSGRLRFTSTLMARETHDEVKEQVRLPAAINGKPALLVLDTGAGISMVREGMANWGRAVRLGKVDAAGIDANWSGTAAIGETLAFADQRIEAPALFLVKDDFPVDGLIGYDCLDGKRLLLEFNTQIISIAQDTAVTTRGGALLPFGIRLVPNQGKVYLGVIPNGTAAAVGLRTGDQLVSIDGAKPNVHRADETQERKGVTVKFSSYPSKITVEVKRSKHVLRRTLKRRG